MSELAKLRLKKAIEIQLVARGFTPEAAERHAAKGDYSSSDTGHAFADFVDGRTTEQPEHVAALIEKMVGRIPYDDRGEAGQKNDEAFAAAVAAGRAMAEATRRQNQMTNDLARR